MTAAGDAPHARARLFAIVAPPACGVFLAPATLLISQMSHHGVAPPWRDVAAFALFGAAVMAVPSTLAFAASLREPPPRIIGVAAGGMLLGLPPVLLAAMGAAPMRQGHLFGPALALPLATLGSALGWGFAAATSFGVAGGDKRRVASECASCGYPRPDAGASECPECGSALPDVDVAVVTEMRR